MVYFHRNSLPHAVRETAAINIYNSSEQHLGRRDTDRPRKRPASFHLGRYNAKRRERREWSVYLHNHNWQHNFIRKNGLPEINLIISQFNPQKSEDIFRFLKVF